MKNNTIYVLNSLLILFLISTSIIGQNFYRSYGSEGNDYGQSIELSPDSGYVVVGATEGLGAGATDGYVIKLDALGNMEWSRTYGGPNIDWITDIKSVSDGYVMCGYSNSYSNGYNSYLLKTDFNGIIIWDTIFGGGDWDFLYSIDVNTAGNIIAAGKSYSGSYGQADGYVIEASMTGQILDTIYMGGPYNDHINDVLCTADGGTILTGAKSVNSNDTDIWIVKIDAAGNTMWENTLGDTLNDEAFHCLELIPGTFLVSGVDEVSTGTYKDHVMIKMNAAGVIEIANYLNEPQDDIGIASTSYAGDSSYVTIGNTTSFYHGETDIRTFECGFNTYGSYTFNYDFGTAEDDFANSVDTTIDKGLVIAGTTEGTAFGFSNIFVHKVDSTLTQGTFTEDVDLSIETSLVTTDYPFFYSSINNCIKITDMSKLSASNYYILDLGGRILDMKTISTSEIHLDLPVGLYIFALVKQTLKFIVE
jgi:hypothetical protein